ncbi:hypothetical protein H072_7119 [Dactylellina haptotyla CBS 200.50]|uniref:DUF726-domain-containing protein n=1 Tax=Dactylellina haptotyla (strain CBS 200.50) TaxID=1284197 RepID=S8ADD9_DACHA|nr:hypothetical protein H072_7119 [Dactylellina haptotyla CBS 200.50]
MPFGIGDKFNALKERTHSTPHTSHAHTPPPSSPKPQYDVDLVTLLTDPQRQDLLNLITAATEVMRTSLLHTFDTPLKKERKEGTASPEGPNTPDEIQKDVDTSPTPPTPPKAPFAQDGPVNPKENVSITRLRHAATTSFDHWQQDLLTRIFDILNPADLESRAGKAAHMQDIIGNEEHSTNDPTLQQAEDDPETLAAKEKNKIDDEKENTQFPAIPTGLSTSLPENAKPVILHSIILLILSLETYDARSRTMLRILSTSLHVPPLTLVTLEEAVAKTLITAAKSSGSSSPSHMSADASKEKQKSDHRWNRRIKIGLAGVAGAAVIGITGGLAAPLVAAGIGTVMSGIGLGATAAAGYLGALAGSGALVGALFGAYGGKMTGEMMQRYSKEIEDFGFERVKPGGTTPKEQKPTPTQEKDHKPATSFEEMGVDRPATPRRSNSSEVKPEDNRLTVTIGISGWITDPADFVSPWNSLSSHTEVYALHWETSALMDLGSALTTMLKTYAFTYLKFEIIKRTVLASLMAAMWPILLLKIGKVVDNPFNIAKTRAEKAGKILADALINRVQGNRPVSLVAYSLGARVVYSCLVELAERRAFGIVENVYILGSATPSSGEGWIGARSVVSGQLVSVYSEKDYILGFLYRTSAVQFGVAGLQEIKWPDGVESVDVSEEVEGHLRYRFLVGSIVGKVGGGEMVDWKVVEEERKKAEEMKRAEEKMEKEAKEKEGIEGEEKELEEAAKKIETEKERRHEQRAIRDVAQMRIAS